MSNLLVLSLILLSGGSLCHSSQLPRIHVDQSSGHFVDEFGRVRIFRGVNSVLKRPPWYEEGLVDRDDWIKDLNRLGWNVVRLGNMWTGWQPKDSKGFNDTYGKILEGILDSQADGGIYTLLDMHQDVLWKEREEGGGQTMGYWGVPPWIKGKLNNTLAKPYPYPLKKWPSGLAWGCGYFTDKISKGFQDYYDNVGGSLDDNARFYAKIADRFKGKTSLLGYEVFNEPFTGDFFKDARRLLPGVAGQEYFVNYYDKVQEAIRLSDQETILFWEPLIWAYFVPFSSSMNKIFKFVIEEVLTPSVMEKILGLLCGTGGADLKLEDILAQGLQIFALLNQDVEPDLESEDPPVWGPGLSRPPGGMDYANRSAMSWHYYCPITSRGRGQKYKYWEKLLCDDILAPLVFNTAGKRAQEVKGGNIMTEFGNSWPDIRYPDSQDTIEANTLLDEADNHFSSWTFWDSNILWSSNSERVLDVNIGKVLARPYPQATAGTPIKMTFDWKTQHFEYEFSLVGIDGTLMYEKGLKTEIIVPPIQYPDQSYQVQISPPGLFKWQVSENLPSVIEIVPTGKQASQTHVKIVIAHSNSII